jgi:hypothetical protein
MAKETVAATRARIVKEYGGRRNALGDWVYGLPRKMPVRLIKSLEVYFSYKHSKTLADDLVEATARNLGWAYSRMGGSYYFREISTDLRYYLDKDTMPFGMRMKKGNAQ